MNWLNLLILLVIAAGHTELVVTIINRVQSLPIARPKLRRFRHFEDLVLVAFPIILLWFVGMSGPRLLHGGSWSEVSTGWRIYFGLCGLGFIGQIWSVARWRLRRPPAVLLSNHSQTVDVAQRLGYEPFGKGPFRYLRYVPGNEVFRVQVSDKRYALPRVPNEWHGLSILHLTDTHFADTVERSFFDEITEIAAQMRPDLIVFTGDLLDDMDLMRWLPLTLGRLQAPLGCYYILGNHDWFYGADEVRRAFDACGWQGVAGQTAFVEHRGHTLEIGGTERPWMGQHPKFAEQRPDFRLLLSHTPDYFSWAREQKVDLMLAGHNHGGQIVLPFVGPVFAPSRYGVRYASGAFWSEPTLLYVSRGLGGRHPVRLNCPPELTRIVLESPATASQVEQPPAGTRPWAGG